MGLLQMVKVKYLALPCTRCKHHTVRPPEKSNGIFVAFCDTCKKKSRYNIVEKNNGEKTFFLSRMGRAGRGLVRQTWFVEAWQAKLSGEDVRLALDKVYKP